MRNDSNTGQKDAKGYMVAAIIIYWNDVTICKSFANKAELERYVRSEGDSVVDYCVLEELYP